MTRDKTIITERDIYRYFQCPHWPYWERYGQRVDRRRLTLAEEDRLNGGLEDEREYAKKFFGDFQAVSLSSSTKGVTRTLELMREGVSVIYQGWLKDEKWLARPDILFRTPGRSVFGEWYYVPFDIRRSHELRKEQKAQLTFYAVLLENVQGYFPPNPGIVNSDGERLTFVASDFMAEFKSVMTSLERVVAGERPEPVYRKSCVDTSPWGKACFQLAEKHDDIALLFNVDIRTLASLRSCGVRTVSDAAVLEPETLEGRAPRLTLRALQAVQRQARSLSERSVIVRKTFKHQAKGLEIFFDIENYTPLDLDYLYGFLINDVPDGRYLAFTARTPHDERKMWQDFLAWLPTLPAEYTVYHYASYEADRMKVMAKRYGDTANPWLERFCSRMVDLKDATRETSVFPLYFYSLKLICGFLGFSWRGQVKDGAQSVKVYKHWLTSQRESHFSSLLEYNEDDVRATAFLLNWLSTYARQLTEYRVPYPWKEKIC